MTKKMKVRPEIVKELFSSVKEWEGQVFPGGDGWAGEGPRRITYRGSAPFRKYVLEVSRITNRHDYSHDWRIIRKEESSTKWNVELNDLEVKELFDRIDAESYRATLVSNQKNSPRNGTGTGEAPVI